MEELPMLFTKDTSCSGTALFVCQLLSVWLTTTKPTAKCERYKLELQLASARVWIGVRQLLSRGQQSQQTSDSYLLSNATNIDGYFVSHLLVHVYFHDYTHFCLPRLWVTSQNQKTSLSVKHIHWLFYLFSPFTWVLESATSDRLQAQRAVLCTWNTDTLNPKVKVHCVSLHYLVVCGARAP